MMRFIGCSSRLNFVYPGLIHYVAMFLAWINCDGHSDLRSIRPFIPVAEPHFVESHRTPLFSVFCGLHNNDFRPPSNYHNTYHSTCHACCEACDFALWKFILKSRMNFFSLPVPTPPSAPFKLRRHARCQFQESLCRVKRF